MFEGLCAKVYLSVDENHVTEVGPKELKYLVKAV